MQLYAQGNDLRLFSEADLIPGGDRVVSEAEVLTECTRFNPKVIYYRPVADKPFLHTIACKLIEKIGCPVVTHIMDDWLDRLHHQNSSLFSKFDTTTRLLLEQSAARLSICDQMSVAFEERYGVDFVAIANCVDPNDWTDLPQSQVPSPSDTETSPFTIRYIGSLADDMNFQSIVDITNSVSQLSQQLPIQLEIYTARFWQNKAVKAFSSLDNVHIHESKFSQQEYRQLLATADALIIAYNFDAESIRYVKYSMANKLPECLASGTPVLAYGPLEVATISYAAETEVVNVVSERNLELLSDKISSLVTNAESYQDIAKKARKYVFDHHGHGKIRSKFQSLLRKASQSSRSPQNLVSSLLGFELESGFSPDHHALLDATQLAIELLKDDGSTAVNLGEDYPEAFKTLANKGFKVMNYDQNITKISEVHDLKNTLEFEGYQQIDFLRISGAENLNVSLLQEIIQTASLINLIECKFENEADPDFKGDFHELSEYLTAQGYIVVVSEWHPRRQYKRQSNWYRLWKYPGQLGHDNAWGYLLAVKYELKWDDVINAAKNVLDFYTLDAKNSRAYMETAEILEKEGQPEAAIQEILEGIEVYPEKLELHYKAGEIFLNLKQFNEAVTHYQKAIEIKPDYFWAFRGLGDAYRGLGELELALNAYEKVVSMNPDYFYGYDRAARVLQMKEEFESAISYYQKALEIKPDSPATQKGLEECIANKHDKSELN